MLRHKGIDQMNNDTENISKKELFKRALSEGLAAKITRLEKELKDTEMPPINDRHKIEMNRLFREQASGDFIPFADIDGEI